jgi:hypothetical protein
MTSFKTTTAANEDRRDRTPTRSAERPQPSVADARIEAACARSRCSVEDADAPLAVYLWCCGVEPSCPRSDAEVSIPQATLRQRFGRFNPFSAIPGDI